MAYEQRDYAGGAVATTLSAGINATDLSISIASATGWPSGGANGPFFVVVDHGLAGEEKIEVASRTGTTLTVASTGKRGVDDTTATTHSSGAEIFHCHTSQDAQEANSHIANTALDHHTQYLNTTRHDVTARHDIGSVIPAAGTPSTITPDAAASNGVSENVARVDHTHAIAAAAASTSGLSNTEGVSTSFARADHTHDQAALSVDTAELVDGAVTAAKIDAAAIDSEALFSTGVSPIIVASSDPGAVGANRVWLNTTSGKRALLKRNAGDTAWEVLQAFDWIAYTPTYPTMPAVGNAVHFARYIRNGGVVIVNGFFKIGSSTNFATMTNLAVGLPTNAQAKDLDSFVNYPTVATAEFFGMSGARCQIGSTTYAGIGVIANAGPAKALDRMHFIATAGSSAAWRDTVPGAWNTGDEFEYFMEYEPATLEDSNWV